MNYLELISIFHDNILYVLIHAYIGWLTTPDKLYNFSFHAILDFKCEVVDEGI